MSLAAPLVLVLGLVVVAALVWLVLVLGRRRAAALRAAGATRATARAGSAGLWLTVAGIGVLAVAAAGPAAALPVPHAAGTVILAMDVSASMGAKDVAPDRLTAAKKAAQAFIQAQPPSVDIGVVAFENGGLAVSQPSADHAEAQAAVERLAPAGGTSLGQAILASLSAITGRTVALGPDGQAPELGYWGSATVVMFSDGEDQGESADQLQAAAEAAQRAGVHVDTVGVGTVAGAAVEVDGYRMRTALDETSLQTIARTTGGVYHPAQDAAQLHGVASTIDLRLTVAEQTVPLGGALIGLALLLLALGAALTMARSGRVV